MLTTWMGFLISLGGILIISKRNLPLALISGAVILGLFTLPLEVVLDRFIYTVTDSSIILLALAMGVIPIIGWTMKKSGQIDSLVNNLRINKRSLMAISPALMGLLPMPGGALLSAPILEKGGEGVADDLKAAINNWFRHLFIMLYPLSPALIVSAEISDLDVYRAIVYLLPGFLLALILGYAFFLRRVHGSLFYPDSFSWSGLGIPLIVILSAPFLDFTLKRIFSMGTLATVIGVTTGLLLSICLSRKKLDLKRIAVGMKPWNFSLIIIGMFLYLHIFQQSDARNLIATLPLPPLTLSITAGFLLGFVTGRVQLPASIILPVYLATADHITPFVFALIYTSIFFGYVISPVHPCLVVTCEYFHVPIKHLITKLALPALIVFIIIFLISVIITH
jgi:integral membrane protein (TIGR00529 family)